MYLKKNNLNNYFKLEHRALHENFTNNIIRDQKKKLFSISITIITNIHSR